MKSKLQCQTYAGKMQQNPGLALQKVQEEFWEIVASQSEKERIIECADFLAHFIFFLNGSQLALPAILNELNARRWDPHLIPNMKHSLSDIVYIGITSEKYPELADNFALNELGIRVIRYGGRNLKIDSQIIDQEKYEKFFKGKIVKFLGVRHKG